MIETCRSLLEYLKHVRSHELMSCTYPKCCSVHFELGPCETEWRRKVQTFASERLPLIRVELQGFNS
jgi:hypothetical protein